MNTTFQLLVNPLDVDSYIANMVEYTEDNMAALRESTGPAQQDPNTAARLAEEDFRREEMEELESTLNECLEAPTEDDIDAWSQETLDEKWENVALEMGMNPDLLPSQKQPLQN